MVRWILLKQWKLGKINRNRSPRIINLPYKVYRQFHLRKNAQNQRQKILNQRTWQWQNRDKLAAKGNSLQDERLQNETNILRLRTLPKTRLVSKLILIHNVDVNPTIGSLSYDDDATTTTTPQNNMFNEKEQSLSYCVFILVHFLAVLYKTRTWNDQILGVFFGEREHTKVNFSFSFLTWTPLLPIWFLNCSPFLQKLSELK